MIASLIGERDGLKGQLIDNGLDPDNNVMDQFVQVEKVGFSTDDDKEQTRIKARQFAREAIHAAVEQAECKGELTAEQAEWFNDMDLLIGLN